jgi:hypothetical protein
MLRSSMIAAATLAVSATVAVCGCTHNLEVQTGRFRNDKH